MIRMSPFFNNYLDFQESIYLGIAANGIEVQ